MTSGPTGPAPTTDGPRQGPPLTGVTVLSLEQAVAAPFATRHLADLGARVIKIERPGGGDFARNYDQSVLGQSSYFVWLNRGKESVQADLKTNAGHALVTRILAHADVFVSNLGPGALDRLDLDAAALRARHPRLTTCTITGYGAHGPYAARKAYDLLIQCETGLLSLTGTAETPAKAGISIADIATGMYAFSGILTALYERRRTGLGSQLSISMLDALGEWVSQPQLYTRYGGTPPAPSGARHASIAPYGPYRVGEGATVFLGVQNEPEWTRLCHQLLHRPDLVHHPRYATNSLRVRHNAELTEIIEAALAEHPAAHVQRELDAMGIANARMRSMDEFRGHPQLHARSRWHPVTTPAGTVQTLLPPITITGRPPVMGSVPALGEHTGAVQAEFSPSAPRARAILAPVPADTPRCDAHGVLRPEPATALAALLDLAADLEPGFALPPLWHWVYLLDYPLQAELGTDGHRTAGFPPVPGPGLRRMFAGGRLEIRRPLRVGEPAHRTSFITRQETKTGRSGPLRFLTLRHQWHQGDEIAVLEDQDLVYRDPPGPGSRSAAFRHRPDARPAPEVSRGEPRPVDNTILFRFSALTHNAHRIHYDRDFAQQEGYPDVVVHGPLQALWMIERLRTAGVELTGRTFHYRLLRPMCGAQVARVAITRSAAGWLVTVRDGNGATTARGRCDRSPTRPAANPVPGPASLSNDT